MARLRSASETSNGKVWTGGGNQCVPPQFRVWTTPMGLTPLSAMIAGMMLALVTAAPASTTELAYRLTEGNNLNAFVRDGAVAAHLLLRSGTEPRILVAFPAGNSGVGLWFEPVSKPASWRIDGDPAPLAKGALHGIVLRASIATARLVPRQAVLSNVRYLRDYQAVGRFPAEVATAPEITGDTIRYARARLDGRPGYALSLRVIAGRIDDGVIVADATGRIGLEITALTGDTPLTPMPIAQLLNDSAAADPAARQALAFLSYREKLLAGSWRFNTYFGRDTLMSVRLLMPVLQPEAIETALNSVLVRLSPGGEVAHEEGIGEFAIVQNRAENRPGDAAELDHGMVDDDYMLAPVAADYLLGAGRARAAAYLAQPLNILDDPTALVTAGALLVRNLRYVIAQAEPFAAAPSRQTLVAIKPGRMTGQWRDSNEGLGGGVFAYDVNAALVPAALAAAGRLLDAGVLDAFLTPADRAALAQAPAMARVWTTAAAPLFRVEMPAAVAIPRLRAYAASLGLPVAPALRALGQEPLVFHALSLDPAGKPIPILNSDEGFVLLFGAPSAADLDTFMRSIMRPFPAGLMTDIGLLVANAAVADPAAQAKFTPGAYHGAVVWSWQQALLAAGIERQLARNDLPPAVRSRLMAAQAALWRAIAAARAVQSSELWSWTWRDGRYQIVPFGSGATDVDESNAAQLWSTVYLAVRPPNDFKMPRKNRLP